MTQTVKVNVYPHTALLNMAYYSVTVIKSKLDSGEREAINLDGANCIIALAFTVEGILNAVGHKLIENWKEKQPYKSKLEECLNALEINETDKEPFITLNTLKEIRKEAKGWPIYLSVYLKHRLE